MTTINTNISALMAQMSIDKSDNALYNSMRKLGTGVRINSASDDAAGLAITDRMTAEINGMQVAGRNTADGISAVQTADGTLKEIIDVLRRMKTLALQAASDTMSSSNREALQKEMTQLQAEIKKMAESTEFNGIKLLDGGKNGISLHTGVASEDSVKFTLPDTSLKTLGIDNTSAIYKGEFITGRINADVTQKAATVYSINGEAWKGKAPVANAANATKAAQAINSNTAQHGVVASAFNEVVGKAPADNVVWKNITINSVTIKTAKSAEEFAKNVNAQLTGQDVVATVNANGGITLSNETGNAITIGVAGQVTGSTDANTHLAQYGLQSNTYEGFVSLKNADGSTDTTPKLTINRDPLAGGTGTNADAKAFGFNEQLDGNRIMGGDVYTGGAGPSTFAFDVTAGAGETGVRLDFGGAHLDFPLSTGVNATRIANQLNQPAKLEFNINNLSTIYRVGSGGAIVQQHGGFGSATALQNALNASTVNDFNQKWQATVTATAGNTAKIILTAKPKATMVDYYNTKTNFQVRISSSSQNQITSSKNIGGLGNWYNFDVNGKSLEFKGKDAFARSLLPRNLVLGTLNASHAFTPASAGSGASVTRKSVPGRSSSELTHDDNIRINGVLIVTPHRGSAEKAAAINAVSKQTGVKASVRAMIEFTKTGESITINGVAITGITENNMADAVKKINQAGGDNFKAELVNGKLRITSNGAPLVIDTGDKTKWKDGNREIDDQTIHGRIILSKVDGSSMDDVTLTAKNQQSMDKLGLTLTEKPADYHTVTGLNVKSRKAVQSTLKKLDKALQTVGKNRADIGAFQNRLEASLSNINQSRVNLTQARGRVLDVDYSLETVTMTKKNILKAGATAMLAQARQIPKEALKMLRGG